MISRAVPELILACASAYAEEEDEVEEGQGKGMEGMDEEEDVQAMEQGG